MKSSCSKGALAVNLTLVTLLAFVTGYYAIFTIQLSGLHSTSETEADIIRQRCPVRLIQPEWVSSQPDRMMNWWRAEIQARFGLIALLWLTAIAILIWRYLKKPTPPIPDRR